MRSGIVTTISLVALVGCTTSVQTDHARPSSAEATPTLPSATKDSQTFVLRNRQNRVNLKPGLVSPGDLVVCDGMTLRVPKKGHHHGETRKVWVLTSMTGSVSMGCRTQVVWGMSDDL